jgi:hypothetical protein
MDVVGDIYYKCANYMKYIILLSTQNDKSIDEIIVNITHFQTLRNCQNLPFFLAWITMNFVLKTLVGDILTYN